MRKLCLVNVKCLTQKNREEHDLKNARNLCSLCEYSSLSVNWSLLRILLPRIYFRRKSSVTNVDGLRHTSDKMCAQSFKWLRELITNTLCIVVFYCICIISTIVVVYMHHTDYESRRHVLWNVLQGIGVQVAWSSIANTFCCRLIKIQIMSHLYPPLKREGRGLPYTRCS